MPDILDYKQTYERGQALADLCRSYEIDADWLAESGDLDQLIARALDDCDGRLRELPEGERELQRVRSLVAFAREASALRECGSSAFSLVSHVDDLERLRNQDSAGTDAQAVQTTDRALELCSDVARLCHKINNPLTSLMGRAQMLQMLPDPGPEKLAKVSDVIEECSRRVAAVVQELAQVVCQGKEDLLRK